MMAIWFVILVALLGLGSLAAVVFAIVYAIANKKPGVALAAVLLPLGAITTVGVLVALFVGRASYHVQGPVHTNIEWALNSPPSPPHVSLPQIVDPISHMRAWVFFLPVVLVVVAFLAFRKHDYKSGKWGWGKTLATGLLLFMTANFFFVSRSRRVEVVHGRQQVESDHAEQIRVDVESAERKAIEAQHAVEDAQRKIEEASQEQAASEHGIEFKTMQELWEKLNQPRIKLESHDKGASMEAGVEGKLVKIEAPTNGESQLIVPISGETPESLNRSLARLERMVERVSEMADQVSDAGTLVGKAMVALSDTIDSQKSSTSAAHDSVTLKVGIDETASKAIAVTPAAAVSHSVNPDSAKAPLNKDSAPSIVELEIDQSKMNEYGVSEREVFKALDNLGLQLGAEHVNDELRKVRAIGGPDSQPVSNLMDTVIAKVGVEGRTVRLNDIAKSIGKTPVKRTVDGVRPDWVDMPAKRVGNAQRRVIVAGDFATREECDREADRLLMLAAAEHVAAITATPLPPAPIRHDDGFIYSEPRLDPRLQLLQRLEVSLDFVRREMARDEYEESVQMSFGPMKRLYTLMEYTPSVDQQLRLRWDAYRREERFAMVGMGAGSVLGLLGMAFGLLKVDTWTKGYYTKRLFLGVPAAIIGLIGLLGLAAS